MMASMAEFKKVLQTSCLIVGAEIDAAVTLFQFPDEPKNGDMAVIVIGSYQYDPSKMDWYVAPYGRQGLSDDIHIHAVTMRLNIFEMWHKFLNGFNPHSMSEMLEDQMVEGFYTQNPEYRDYLIERRKHDATH